VKYTDLQRVKKMYENAKKLERYISKMHIDKKMVIDDYTIQWAVTTPLFQIGEHAYYLSNEFKEAHGELKWHAISGLRHRLVHDYDDTNWSLIADIIFQDIPILITQTQEILEKEYRENDE